MSRAAARRRDTAAAAAKAACLADGVLGSKSAARDADAGVGVEWDLVAAGVVRTLVHPVCCVRCVCACTCACFFAAIC